MPTLLAGLVKANCLVLIEKQSTARNDYGYLTETYATLADDVPISFTITGGTRDKRFESQLDVQSGQIWCSNVAFANSNIRVKFKDGQLAGLYGRIESTQGVPHGNPLGLIPDSCYVANWTEVDA